MIPLKKPRGNGRMQSCITINLFWKHITEHENQILNMGSSRQFRPGIACYFYFRLSFLKFMKKFLNYDKMKKSHEV